MKAILYYDYLNFVKNKKVLYTTLGFTLLFSVQVELQTVMMGGNGQKGLSLNLFAPLVVWCVSVFPVLGFGKKDFDNSLLDLYNQRNGKMIELYFMRTIIPIIFSVAGLVIFTCFWYYSFSIPIENILSFKILTLVIGSVSLSFSLVVIVLILMYFSPENDMIATLVSIFPLLFYMIVPIFGEQYFSSIGIAFATPIVMILLAVILCFVFSKVLNSKYRNTLKVIK